MKTTKCYVGSGQVTRTVRIEDKRGRVHNIAVTVYGCKVLLVIDAVTKILLAVKAVKIHEHEALWTRALVAQARTNLAGNARLHKVVFDKAFLAGTDVRWLNQHGLCFVVPAKENMAVTADAQAQAMAGEGISVGRRVHTVRHGQGKTAWSVRLETEVVGIMRLTTTTSMARPSTGASITAAASKPTTPPMRWSCASGRARTTAQGAKRSS